MFIKLTKSDGSPVWLNPEFIVRIEAWKTGSAVAAAGDGDFEVRETPSSVIALINAPAAPAPQPMPSVPKPEPANPAPAPTAPAEPEELPKRKTRTRKKAAQPDPAPVSEPVSAPPPPAPPAEPVPPTEPLTLADSLFPDAPDDISVAAAILKKNRCRSRKRIENTLKSRNPKMSMAEVRAMLQQMESRGLVVIDAQGHAVFT